MSYTRDKDAYTRSAGAIAAFDRDPRMIAARKRKLARSKTRDTAMAQLTYGARGGLGRINLGTGTGPTGRPSGLKPGVVEGGRPLVVPPPVVGGPMGTGGHRGGGSGFPTTGGNGGTWTKSGLTAPLAPATPHGTWTKSGLTAPLPLRVGMPRPPMVTPGAVLPTPGQRGSRTGKITPQIWVDPGPVQTTGGATGPTSGGSSSAGGSTGGGGGGMLTGGTAGAMMPWSPPVPTVDPNTVVDVPAASSGKNFLILAALLGGAYLLLRDDDGDDSDGGLE